MGFVKNYYHDQITAHACEMEQEEPCFFEWEQPLESETDIDFFPDRRIDFRGYEEFKCDLCGEMSVAYALHPECIVEEEAAAA